MWHQPLAAIVPLLFAAGTTLVLAYVAWRRRSVAGAGSLAGLLVAAAIWSAAYALELASPGLTAKILWAKVQYLGITSIPLFWVAFAVGYTGSDAGYKRAWLVLALACVVPLVTLILAWAYPLQRLLWADVLLIEVAGWPLGEFVPGPWFALNVAFSYGALLAGAILIATRLRQRQGALRKQALALLIMVFAPWVANVAYVFNLTPWPQLDFTPFGFVVVGAALLVGLLRFRLLSAAELQGLVDERTSQLARRNAQLGTEIAEREDIERQLAERAAELTALHAVALDVNASLSVDQVARAVLATVHDVVRPDLTLLYLLADGWLRLAGAEAGVSGVATPYDRYKQVGVCLCGQAAAEGHALYSREVRSDPRCVLTPCPSAGVHSFAALPLKQGGQVVGVLGLASLVARDFEAEAAFLESLAVTAALGLGNALLYRQVQAQLADLQVEIEDRQRAEKALATYRDELEAITARRTAELRESEARYRTVVETSPDAISLLDTSGRPIAVNPQMLRLHGFADLDEARAANPFGVVTAPFQGRMQSMIAQARAATSDHPVFRDAQVTLRRVDGSTFPAEISLAVVRDTGGTPTGMIAVYRDITERVAAQAALQTAHQQLEARVRERTAELEASTAALRRSQQRLIEAQSLAHLGSWEWEVATGQIIWSEEVYRVFGREPGDAPVTFESFLQSVHPGDRSDVQAAVDAVLAGNASYGIDHRIVLPDGRLRVVHEQGQVIRDTTGVPLRMTGTVQDITLRKQAEDAVWRQNQRLRALNAVAAVISRELDLRTGLQEVLEELLRLPGTTAAWIQMAPGTETGIAWVTGGIDETEAAGLARAFEAEIEQVLHTQTAASLRPDGAGDTSSTLLVVPIRARESVLGVLAALSSTAAAEAEETLPLLEGVGHQVGMAVENAQLVTQASQIEVWQELDRLRSELVSNVSHEIRTPLGLIKLFATTLLLEEFDVSPEQQREFLSGIEEETENLERIVADLLTLGRGEGGRMPLERQVIDLQQVASSLVGSMRLDFGGRRLVRDFVDHPLLVYADPHRMTQVLRNLISNALKYSPDTGKITLRARQNDDEAVLCVVDEGIGIPAEAQPHVFERFYRVDSEVTRRTRGAGLGLAISRAIVEAHGGRIWFESRPGEGSTFCFGLPRAPSGAGTGEPSLAVQGVEAPTASAQDGVANKGEDE